MGRLSKADHNSLDFIWSTIGICQRSLTRKCNDWTYIFKIFPWMLIGVKNKEKIKWYCTCYPKRENGGLHEGFDSNDKEKQLSLRWILEGWDITPIGWLDMERKLALMTMIIKLASSLP